MLVAVLFIPVVLNHAIARVPTGSETAALGTLPSPDFVLSLVCRFAGCSVVPPDVLITVLLVGIVFHPFGAPSVSECRSSTTTIGGTRRLAIIQHLSSLCQRVRFLSFFLLRDSLVEQTSRKCFPLGITVVRM
jgi:hypothetical protein